jgi:hypothetical protein
MPRDASFNLRGFESEEKAREFGRSLWSTVHEIGRYIDLERLDGVTVGWDYDEALLSVDRGIDGLRPLSRSDGEVVGIAMSPPVLRDGVVKVHLVFGANYLVGLMADDQSEDVQFAVAVVAHECAHVEVTKQRDLAFPGTVLQAHYDGYEAEIFGQIADICWEEYAACRLAAPFSSGKCGDYTKGLEAVLAVGRKRSNHAIRAYRRHADLNRVINEAGSALCEPLKVASYLLGHMDAVRLDWPELPATRQVLVDAGYAELVDDLRNRLRVLWHGRQAWDSIAEFDPLREVVRGCFASGGFFFSGRPDGTAYVEIPFSPETMPGEG